jgi:hypothetical protein
MFSPQGVFYGGKNKGKWLSDYSVEPNYLRWMYWHLDLGDTKDQMILRELRRRREPIEDGLNNQDKRDEKAGTQRVPVSRQFPSSVNLSIMLEIIRSGRQSLSKRHHPDVGGDLEMMKQINITADALSDWLTAQGVGK